MCSNVMVGTRIMILRHCLPLNSSLPEVSKDVVETGSYIQVVLHPGPPKINMLARFQHSSLPGRVPGIFQSTQPPPLQEKP